MRKNIRISLVLLLFFTSVVEAKLWESVVESNYKSSEPALFLQLKEAQALIDSYSRGKRDNLQKAGEILTDVLKKDEKFAPAYVQMTRLMIYMGYLDSQKGYELAKKQLDTAISIEPEYAEAYIMHAVVSKNLYRWDDVRNYLKEAKNRGTTSPWYDINMGRLLKKEGHFENATKYFDAVLNRTDVTNRTKSFAINELQKYYFAKGDYKSAAKYLEKMIDLFPEEVYSWGNYGTLLLYQLGEVDKSIKYLKKTVDMYPYQMAKDALAAAYYSKWAELQNSDHELAEKFLVKGQKINPAPQLVYNAIAKGGGYPALGKTLTALEVKHGIKGVRYIQPAGYKGPKS